MASPFRVALTFDDGPHPKNTGALVKICSERLVPATFFVLGENVGRWPDTVRFIHEAGHEIGNHGWSHSSFGAVQGRGCRGRDVATEQRLSRVVLDVGKR